MKTVILNGSPRPRGDTAAMIAALREVLPGEVTVIDAYRAKVAPCIDCRRCWTAPGCVIGDGFSAILAAIADADCVVIASPVYFSTLTGPLLSLCSRLQVVYTAVRHHGQRLVGGPKVGAILLCGGGEGDLAPAETVARGLLRAMRASVVGVVTTHCTDRLPATEDSALLATVRALGEGLATAIRE